MAAWKVAPALAAGCTMVLKVLCLIFLEIQIQALRNYSSHFH